MTSYMYIYIYMYVIIVHVRYKLASVCGRARALNKINWFDMNSGIDRENFNNIFA